MRRAGLFRSDLACVAVVLAGAVGNFQAARAKGPPPQVTAQSPPTGPVNPAPLYRFSRDTFAFANETVYRYVNGIPSQRQESKAEKAKRFVQHCFVMCRASKQFRNFARFEPALPPDDDRTLTAKVRQVTHYAAWRAPLPRERRVVIPGYADLRELSQARAGILQRNCGVWWTTYVRPGNYKMFFAFATGPTYQGWTQRAVERAINRHEVFIAYLTTFPHMAINHACLIYARNPRNGRPDKDGLLHYFAYDPNHPESPRDMAYNPRKRRFLYQRDWDFVGGKVTVLQILGHPLE